jgi:hypothetical protein
VDLQRAGEPSQAVAGVRGSQSIGISISLPDEDYACYPPTYERRRALYFHAHFPGLLHPRYSALTTLLPRLIQAVGAASAVTWRKARHISGWGRAEPAVNQGFTVCRQFVAGGLRTSCS